MKDILKSKIMVGFILFVLAFTYINSLQTNQVDYQGGIKNAIASI